LPRNVRRLRRDRTLCSDSLSTMSMCDCDKLRDLGLPCCMTCRSFPIGNAASLNQVRFKPLSAFFSMRGPDCIARVDRARLLLAPKSRALIQDSEIM
jgi:hypothetical protein